jgi:hypothetical protein
MSINGKDEPVLTGAPDMVPMIEVQALINELTWQRNTMGERAANLAVQLRLAQKELEDLKAAPPKPIFPDEPRPPVTN